MAYCEAVVNILVAVFRNCDILQDNLLRKLVLGADIESSLHHHHNYIPCLSHLITSPFTPSMDGQMDRQKDGLTDRQEDRWTDGCSLVPRSATWHIPI